MARIIRHRRAMADDFADPHARSAFHRVAASSVLGSRLSQEGFHLAALLLLVATVA